jgi:AcrR family transcriptional regulator
MRYEKGRKDASRQRIIDVAAERFRCDGIAATGLAGIMSDAGLTNGAFYPHFASKADLVRESVGAAIAKQAEQMEEILAAGGIHAVIEAYLSPAHRDDATHGCPLASLLPELARQPLDARSAYAEQFHALIRALAQALPQHIADRDAVAMAVLATLTGTLQLARAVEGALLSDRILTAGADAARMLVQG